MKITYNKLVRDLIPNIIEQSGKTYSTEVLNDQDFLKQLEIKLSEEVQEYLDSGNTEELADILEVLYAIARVKHVTREQLEQMRQDKARERGGFDKQIFLHWVQE